MGSAGNRLPLITRRSAIAAAAAGGIGVTIGTGSSAASDAGRRTSGANRVRHKTISIDGLDIFYREAGASDAPAILLLHGFPASSHMFRHLLPALADRWRVIAPDYPGFGFSEYVARDDYPYSFSAFASTMAKFTNAIGLAKYAIYIQDYGAPVGLRLALHQPDRVVAIVAQNGNAYEEGLSGGWEPIRNYWKDPSPENRKLMRGWLDAPGVRLQYIAGIPAEQIELFAPESWALDWQLLNRPGNIDLQLDLFYDYRTNLDLYPSFHDFFRQHRPAVLIPWGRFDPFFTVAGAEAYLKDVPDAELHLLDAGHFALESHTSEIIGLTRDFLARNLTA
jgi:pimeloyl-ACP methyl ester carboxylesterase